MSLSSIYTERVINRFEDFIYIKGNGFNIVDILFLIKMLVRSVSDEFTFLCGTFTS